MTWSAFLQTVRVRAVEETDAEGTVWDEELRRNLTRDAGQGTTTMQAFLDRRATSLASRGRYHALAPLLRWRSMPSWLVLAGWVAAFLIGWALAALGQESEINLLALPLIGILLWNAVVVVLSLWPTRQDKPPQEDDWRENLLRRFAPSRPGTVPVDQLAASSIERFDELVREPGLRRFAFRFRAWLHLGAALLALGSISGMYTRGWSKEYRAVWESTLLDEPAATRFFGALFSPASAVIGRPIPLDELPGMRRRANAPAEKPGDALPWIHLYAATLGLFVLIPRVLLSLWDRSRADAIPARTLQEGGWLSYAQRLRSLVEGAGAPAVVLTHGLTVDAAARDRWHHWAYLHWRDVGPLAFDTVPLGAEGEFVNAWLPATSRVMLVFNMAATPEAEVQRALVESLLKKLKTDKAVPTPLLLALDDADLRKRWAGFGDLPARLAERAAAWSEAMNGTGVLWHEVVMPARSTK